MTGIGFVTLRPPEHPTLFVRFLLRLMIYCSALPLLVSAAGCPVQTGSAGARSMILTPCRVKGIDTEVRCGDLSVLENRGLPAGRHIPIHVTVLPSLSRTPLPDAVFIFAGGPGQAAGAAAGIVAPLFAKLNRNRDIVFVDQRGTGKSAPLACADLPESNGLTGALDASALAAYGAQCVQKLQTEGADLTQYTTAIAAVDLDAARAALGYPSINLWGASYGTRAALEYARQYPQHVRTMVLDGVAPPWMKLPISFAFDTDRAIDLTVADCAKDVACKKNAPDLAAQLDGLFSRVRQNPIAATVHQPVSGVATPVKIGIDTLASWLRGPLYTSLTASLLPAALVHAAQGDFDQMAALGAAGSDAISDNLSLGMHLSVVCSEDMAAITDADIASLASTRSRSTFYDEYASLCKSWPRGKPPAGYFAPAPLNVPALLLSGGIDPATPPQHASELARLLPQSANLVAPNLGHGVSLQGCAPDLIEKFIRTADWHSVTSTCLAAMPRPPFFKPIEARHD